MFDIVKRGKGIYISSLYAIQKEIWVKEYVVQQQIYFMAVLSFNQSSKQFAHNLFALALLLFQSNLKHVAQSQGAHNF